MTKLRLSSLVLVSCVAFAACGKHDALPNTPPAPATANASTSSPTPTNSPTDERLRARAQERMDLIAKGDWLAAYEFQSPEGRRILTLQDFLAKKDTHRYEKPHAHDVLRNDGKLAFIRVTALWTPTHQLLKNVKLEPGQSLTQEVELYQTWVWADGDWAYSRGQSPDDFFADHRDLLSKPSDGASAATTAVPAPAAGTPK